MSDHHNSLILGIDTGTTSVKLSLLDAKTRNVVESYNSESGAYIAGEQSHAEQDVSLIISALENSLCHVSVQNLSRVAHIEICGQMHGCMLWKGNSCWDWNLSHESQHSSVSANKVSLQNVSRLITWEDRRCTRDFLSKLPSPRSNVTISTGFGCASIFWLQRYYPTLLGKFDCAGTVMDFIVCMLCGLIKPFMSSHNAVSWGYFDPDGMTWELDVLESANFPTYLLPTVQKPGFVAGKLQRSLLGIPDGTPVGVALGDFQCSVLAAISQPNEAVLNFGTSCQMAVVVHDSERSQDSEECPSGSAIQLFPFFKGMKLIAAASLSGGNALAAFVTMLKSWLQELGVSDGVLSMDDIYQKVLDCAGKKGSTTLRVLPTFWGERHTPDQKGEICNVSSDNITLGDAGLALCRGLIENMQRMVSRDFLLCHSVQRIVGTGSALMRNPVLQKQVEQVYGLPLVLRGSVDASVGAALAVMS